MIINGSGQVTYTPEGRRGIDDLIGPQSYFVPKESIAAILDMAEKADFWSLRDKYKTDGLHGRPDFSDDFHTTVMISLGGRTKSVQISPWGGAPKTTDRLMFDMARLGKAELWWQFDDHTIEMLASNGFDFKSKKGGNLLIAATRRSTLSDSSLYGLIARGAPLDFVEPGDIETALLDAAIDGHRGELVDNLIRQGALLTHDKPDPVKITRAFVHAVVISDPDMVDKLTPYHPNLIFRHRIYKYPRGTMIADDPVITFVGGGRLLVFWDDESGINRKLIAVTQKLLNLEADLNSRDSSGQSLLSHAVEAHDVEFVRWLIAKGAQPAEAMLHPMYDDETTVLLLEAGIKLSDEALKNIIDNAKDDSLPKTEAWLKAHGKWPQE